MSISQSLEQDEVTGLLKVLRTLYLYRVPLLVGLLLACISFLVIYPIVALSIIAFLPTKFSAFYGTIPWHKAFEEPGMWQSALNTLAIVAATQFIALPISIFIAWLLARTDVPGARTFEFCFWLMFFLPSLGVLTGWLLLFDPNFGLMNEWILALGLASNPPFNLYSFWGIVFVHVTTYGIAVKVMLLTPAFRNLDSAIEEASRICGAGRLQTLVRIVLPLMAPAIMVVLIMSIIRGLETFEIELILGAPIKLQVYSTKLYLLMSDSPPEFNAAGTLGLSMLALIIPLILLERWSSTRRSYVTVNGRGNPASVQLGIWRLPAFVFLLLFVSSISLLPFLMLIAGSFMTLFGFFDLPQVWTFAHWSKALSDITFLSSLNNMLTMGFGAAVLAVLVYSLVAYCVVRVRTRLAGPLDLVSWLPICVPGVVLSFGYLNMSVQVPLFAIFYGTVWSLIFISFLSAMPLGVQVLKVHMLQLGNEIEEAGRVVGGSWHTTFRTIIVPLAAPALAVVGIIVFASTIRYVASVMLLSSGNNRVLSVLQVEFLSSGSLGPAAVVGTVIMLISLTAAMVVRLMSNRFGIHAR